MECLDVVEKQGFLEKEEMRQRYIAHSAKKRERLNKLCRVRGNFACCAWTGTTAWPFCIPATRREQGRRET